ncbi:cytochrome P450, partial [Vibrio parahaemolyticus]
IDDPEYLKIRHLNEEQNNVSGLLVLTEYIPLLRLFLIKQLRRFNQVVKEFVELISNKYYNHLKDYQEGIIRDFTDAMIFSKEEALKSEKES